MSRIRLEWAGMHLECISIAAGIYFDITRIQLECNSNVVGIFRLPLECGLEFSRNVPIGPQMSPDLIQNTAESHIQEYINNFHSASFRLIPPLLWLGLKFPPECGANFENSSFRLILADSKCDGGILAVWVLSQVCKVTWLRCGDSVYSQQSQRVVLFLWQHNG